MYRRGFLANLIYFIMTNVQLGVWASPAWAMPSLKPVPATREQESEARSEASREWMESMVVSEEQSRGPELLRHRSGESKAPPPLSFELGYWQGPFSFPENQRREMGFFGLSWHHSLGPSHRRHGALYINGTPHPVLHLREEIYLRNHWIYLKSWNPILELEMDPRLQLGAFLTLSNYAAGVGFNFWRLGRGELRLNWLPIAKRGFTGSVVFTYLAF